MSDFALLLRAKLRFSQWRRKRVQRKFGGLFQEVALILFRHDPIGINSEDNTDEYDPEVGTILPRLTSCSSAGDVRRVVFLEFRRWFGEETAGDEMKYDSIAKEIWELWSIRRARH